MSDISSHRGKFYEEKAITLPSEDDKKFLMRTITSKLGRHEFETLRQLRHERIVKSLAAFSQNEQITLILESLEAGHIAHFLSLRRKYSENIVSSVIRQVNQLFK